MSTKKMALNRFYLFTCKFEICKKLVKYKPKQKTRLNCIDINGDHWIYKCFASRYFQKLNDIYQ